MNKLTFNKVGKLSDICQKNGGQNALCFLGCSRGRLTLGEHSFPVKDGVCLPNIFDIPDGTYTPVLHFMGKSIELSRIKKCGSELYEAYPSEEEIRNLTSKIDHLEAQMLSALEEIKRLRDTLDGQTVFEI